MVKPVKINPDQRFSRAWQPKQRVWFQKNDDRKFKEYKEKNNVKYCADCNMTQKRISAKKCGYCGNEGLINLDTGEGS